MNEEQVQALSHGLYRVHWAKHAGGGTSLAAVGSTHSGGRWICCTNWTSSEDDFRICQIGATWQDVERAEKITGEIINKPSRPRSVHFHLTPNQRVTMVGEMLEIVDKDDKPEIIN